MSLERICLGRDQNCDNQICRTARKNYQIVSKARIKEPGGETKQLFHCLPGLKDLEDKNGKCMSERLSYQKKLAGVDDISVILSKTYARSHVDCRNLFGELYVLVSCTGLCGDMTPCPLKPLAVTHDTKKCYNLPKNKIVFSLAEDDALGLAVQTSRDRFSKAMFSCADGFCTSFDKVCNLDVDCRDESDERNCTNNYKCTESGEYIPLSRKCDGEFDCYDFSDECNEECRTHTVMFHHISLSIIALAFGILAFVLNFVNLVRGLGEFSSLKTQTAMVNKCFVLLIAFSDLLQGLFLMVLSIGDKFFNDSTCTTQFKWTTSVECKLLGVISTIGSLLSLYSMTILSIIRASNVGSLTTPKEKLSKKGKIKLGATVMFLLVLTSIVATAPLFPLLEDYFVQYLNYGENSLFVGAPDKQRHKEIIDSYYGRVLYKRENQNSLPWDDIRNLVKDMFTNDVTGSNLGFYGSNGFCLFSYFVRKGVSYRWFSMAVLATNLACVVIIGASYIYVNQVARKTASAIKNSPSAKANRKLQRKITIIITTDVLTWLPFIVVCAVNYTELVDTSSWYSIFCIFFLPINSIINPIGIYDETVFHWFVSAAKNFKSVCGSVLSRMQGIVSSNEDNPDEIEMDTMPLPQNESNTVQKN